MKILERIRNKKQRILRALFGTFSATALMFTFQACYGMPPSIFLQPRGQVLDAETGEPVEGLQVNLWMNPIDTTDHEGYFAGDLMDFQTDMDFRVDVIDIDSTEHGLYERMDTMVPVYQLQDMELKVQRIHEDS
jgi:5-hydroxyisourate hydrolase-like protein (transthyretin family)